MGDQLERMKYISQGGDDGRQLGLRMLVGQAYNAPPDQQQALLGRVAAQGEPGMAMAAQNSFDEQSVKVHADLAQRAKLVVGLFQAGSPMAQQAYASMLPIAQRAGYPVDSAAHGQLTQDMIPGLSKLASALAPQTDMPGSYKEYQLAQNNPGYGQFLSGQQPTQLTSIPVPGGSMTVQWNPRTKQMTDLQGNAIDAQGNPVGGQAPPQAQQGASAYAPAPEVTQGIDMTVNPGENVPQSDEVAMIAAAQNPGTPYVPQANGGALPLGMPTQPPGMVNVSNVQPAPQAPNAPQAAPGRIGFKPDKADPSVIGKRMQELQDLRGAGQQFTEADASAYLRDGKFPDSGQDAAGLSDAAIDNAATRYNITGIIPPLGMGQAAAAQRSRILDRAAALAGGQTASELATQPADYKNSQATLRGLQQSSAGMSRATGALHANANLLLAASERALGGSLTGSRIENEARLAWGRQTNDPDVAAYDQYVQTVANEYAKIMGGAPGSNAAATEGARADAERAIHKAASPEALRSTIDSLYHEAENFRNANEAEIARLRATLTGAKPAAGADQPPAAHGDPQQPAQRGPAIGTIEDGHRFKGGNPADPASWEVVR